MNRILSLTLMCAIAVTPCQVFGTEEHRDASEPCACACCCPCCECQQISCADTRPTAHQITEAEVGITALAFCAGAAIQANEHEISTWFTHTAQTITQQCTKAKAQAVGLVNSVKEKCLPLVHNVLNHERVQAALTYARNTANQAGTYAKENPVKTALITVGASVVAATAYALARGARHAYRRYQAYHNCYCVCCGKKIGSREQKHETARSESWYRQYYCTNCYNHIENQADNGYEARYKLLYH